MDESTQALINVLKIYGNTDKPVSQGFYLVLCIMAAEALQTLETANNELSEELRKERAPEIT